MKTPIIDKTQGKIIIDPYKITKNYTSRALDKVIFSFPPQKDEESKTEKGWMMYGDGSFHQGGNRRLYIYMLPASVATIKVNINTDRDNFINAKLNKDKQKVDEQRPALAFFDKGLIKGNVCQVNETGYLHLGYKTCAIVDIENVANKWVEVPRLFFSNINDYVYLVISCIDEPLVEVHDFPENQPFFWDKPVATSIYDDQSLSDSKIISGVVKYIVKITDGTPVRTNRKLYIEKSLLVDYAWAKSKLADIATKNGNNQICTIVNADVNYKTEDGNCVGLIKLPVYVYKRNRNGKGNDITVFVWHSGNKDDMVKKSMEGFREDDAQFYNENRYLLDSLSLETIYHSFASLTKISEDSVARYIVRTLAHQPEGNRCVSIEGHLLHLIGGVLYYIECLLKNGDAKEADGKLKDEYYNRVVALYNAIGNNYLRYDANVDFGLINNNADRTYVEKILGIKNGSNGCQRLASLLRKVFSYVHNMGISVDYIYCDIENIYGRARDLLVHRFGTEFQHKWKGESQKSSFYSGIIFNEIQKDDEFKEAFNSLGYSFGEEGSELEDVSSVLAGDENAHLHYGISNEKSYAKRRNLNVWDVVMNNYTNKLFYDYIFKPILHPLGRPFKGIHKMPICSADSRYHSKGYHNRAEYYETYLGGSLKLSGGMYSSIPLYGDHMTRGYIKPNMDNWHILPEPSLFSFFMDHINRLRVTALSSDGKFNVFIPTWNMWAFEINKILEFRLYDDKGNIIKQKESTENKAIAYHKELLFHTFLMNPDKAIAYFNLDSTVDDKEHYINLEAEKNEGYFKFAYDELQKILIDVNNELGEGLIIPKTQTLAVETEPYVLSCAEVNKKWIWRLTVNEEIAPEIGTSTASFIVGGRKITFNNVRKCTPEQGIGFWIETLKDVKPQVFSNTENFYTDHPAINNIGDFSLNPIDGKLTLVDSYKDKNNENKETPSDYLCLSFPYNQYTVLGEIPKYHSISMKFKIDRDMNKTCYLLQLSALQNEQGKLICFALNPNSIQCTDTVPFSLLNVKNANKPSFDITKGETYTLVVSFKITAIVENEFSGDVYYKLTDETEQKIWTSGILNWNFYNSMGNQCLADDIKLWNHKQRPGCLMADNKPVLLSSLLKKYLEGIDEDKQETERINWLTDMYKKVLDSAPVAIEDFSLCISGHQEKVELFREDNGLNITRVNKEVIAYAESELYEAFSDAMIAKFSWLNAEAKSIRYNLSFSEKVDKDNTDCPHGNCIKLSQASDKSIEIEVMPQSEGYILIRFPEGTRKISDIFYNLKEI